MPKGDNAANTSLKEWSLKESEDRATSRNDSTWARGVRSLNFVDWNSSPFYFDDFRIQASLEIWGTTIPIETEFHPPGIQV